MESQKAETLRFASNDFSDFSVANRRSSRFLRDLQKRIKCMKLVYLISRF
mgnify:CR=1 FL=1